MFEQKKKSSIVTAGRLCQYASGAIWVVLAIFIFTGQDGAAPVATTSASELVRVANFMSNTFTSVMRGVGQLFGTGIAFGAGLWLLVTGILLVQAGQKAPRAIKPSELTLHLILVPMQMMGALLGLAIVGDFSDPEMGVRRGILMLFIWILYLGFSNMSDDK